MWLLICIIAIALIAGIVWSYNKKTQKRTAERAQQFDELLSELKRSPHLGAGGTPGVAPQVSVSLPPTPPEPPSPPGAGLDKKQRLLPQSGALLYFVFRAGLPDHEIFVNLTLADVIDIGPGVQGYEREQKARRLAQRRLDLVICTKQLEVVAAVLFEPAPNASGARDDDRDFIASCLQAAGIRLLRIDTAAPPRHQRVRELVYGADLRAGA